MNLENKTVIVVGASSGIGRSVALLLARMGNRVVVTARRAELLEALAAEIHAAGGQCLAIAADAMSEEAMKAVYVQAGEAYGTIDAALINIGDGPDLDLSVLGADEVMRIMAINYETVVNSLMPLISVMKAQGHGLIAHTNSLAGFLGLPKQGPYSAAKAAGRILMDTCRIELAPWGLKFVSVYPGFIATERVADDGIPAPFEISEESAAEHIVYAMEKEKADYLFPFPMRWLIRLGRVLPKSFVAFLSQKMMSM